MFVTLGLRLQNLPKLMYLFQQWSILESGLLKMWMKVIPKILLSLAAVIHLLHPQKVCLLILSILGKLGSDYQLSGLKLSTPIPHISTPAPIQYYDPNELFTVNHEALFNYISDEDPSTPVQTVVDIPQLPIPNSGMTSPRDSSLRSVAEVDKLTPNRRLVSRNLWNGDYTVPGFDVWLAWTDTTYRLSRFLTTFICSRTTPVLPSNLTIFIL